VAAKCLAGRAQTLAATHCHQVQGGIAFTAEHGFHRVIQRGHLLDALLGTTRELTRTLGHQLLADGSVPRTPQLSA
jgi:alkylation response protein AidB-like acyl-CoA dehydrogenase